MSHVHCMRVGSPGKMTLMESLGQDKTPEWQIFDYSVLLCVLVETLAKLRPVVHHLVTAQVDR